MASMTINKLLCEVPVYGIDAKCHQNQIFSKCSSRSFNRYVGSTGRDALPQRSVTYAKSQTEIYRNTADQRGSYHIVFPSGQSEIDGNRCLFCECFYVRTCIGFGSKRVIQEIVTGLTSTFSDLAHIGDLVRISGYPNIIKGIAISLVELQNALTPFLCFNHNQVSRLHGIPAP